LDTKDSSKDFKINKQFENRFNERKQKEKAKEISERLDIMNSETSSLSVDEDRVLGGDEEVKEFLEGYQKIKENKISHKD
jgi:hypothetical protein